MIILGLVSLKKFVLKSPTHQHIIFSLSFTTGVVPDSIKLDKVILVYKKGEKKQPGNYRQISLLSVFDKVLEKINELQTY